MRKGWDPNFTVCMLSERKYLAFNIYPARDLGFCNNLHTCLASIVLLKASRSLNPNFTVRMLSERKYLDFNIYLVRDLGFCNNLCTCLASIALLKAFRSLNPRPSLDLVLPSFTHFLQWTPC